MRKYVISRARGGKRDERGREETDPEVDIDSVQLFVCTLHGSRRLLPDPLDGHGLCQSGTLHSGGAKGRRGWREVHFPPGSIGPYRAQRFVSRIQQLLTQGDETVRLTNQEGTSPSFLPGLQREARQLKVHITAGVHLPTEDAGRCANVSVWIDSEGEILHSYQKLHLFDVDIKNGPILKESKTTQPGSGMVEPFGTPIGRVGMQICYDLRFPELSLRLRRLGAQVLLFPSVRKPFSHRSNCRHSR